MNSHSGHDSWTAEQGVEFFQRALEIEARVGMPTVHETHRRRLLWNPWSTRDVLAGLQATGDAAALKINCDLSHWVCVGERLFDETHDPEFYEILAMLGRHVHLIHGRVGHDEGPQVPDPSSPLWADALAAHEAWWDELVDAMVARGVPVRFEGEHGPPPYQARDASTGAPVGSLWEHNAFVRQRAMQRFAAKYGPPA